MTCRNAGPHFMESQILRFVAEGDLSGVFQELTRGTPIEGNDRYTTPLLEAIRSPKARIDMLQLLISMGADVNRPTRPVKKRPLSFAICTGNIEKIDFLIRSGADLHFVHESGYDAILDSVYCADLPRNSTVISTIDYLLSAGANTFSISKYGESALRVASRLGRFDVVDRLLQAGAPYEQLGWNPLMHAIALGSITDVENLLRQSPGDLECRDWWERTPWLLSLQVGDIVKSQLLLSAGAGRHARGRRNKPPLAYPIINDKTDMLKWLLSEGFDTEEPDEAGNTPLILAAESGSTECVRLLLEAGANPSAKNHIPYNVMREAANLDIVRLLLDHGESLDDLQDDMRRQLLGLQDKYLHVSDEEYRAGRYRRFGKANPEQTDIPFWRNMVAAGVGSWRARKVYGDDDHSRPVWSYERFGRTLTQLPDARFIEIAGEHEDHYDPDFCIYNDVVVHDGQGGFTIWSYPEDAFPPTDFHTATLVDNHIYIIGSLGYWGKRIYGETPVYRLDCQSMAIEKLESRGEMPGWINSHKARYSVDENAIIIGGGNICFWRDGKEFNSDNNESFKLDLPTLTWTRLDTRILV